MAERFDTDALYDDVAKILEWSGLHRFTGASDFN